MVLSHFLSSLRSDIPLQIRWIFSSISYTFMSYIKKNNNNKIFATKNDTECRTHATVTAMNLAMQRADIFVHTKNLNILEVEKYKINWTLQHVAPSINTSTSKLAAGDYLTYFFWYLALPSYCFLHHDPPMLSFGTLHMVENCLAR